jgi:hypothetical protein
MRTTTRQALSFTFATACIAIISLGVLMLLAGCTGKTIDLYSPTTGAKLATYRNTTDSEIGGLEATYDPATGAFTVKVKSSSQSASESNAAMWAAMSQLINKIPVAPIP